MVESTLNNMAAGGMYDHVGGGFHRYSTDKKWLVPHFEKMLYDNALLAMTYLEAYQVTHNQYFANITRDILRYVERDMTSSEGVFYSATDADSLGPDGHTEEGYFFTWTPAELDNLLGKEQAKVIKAYYSVTEKGNFEGRSLFRTRSTPSEMSEQLKLSEKEIINNLNEAKDILYQARLKRPLPLRDEKALTAWNGLMISAFAKAGLILDDPAYTQKAITAAQFILNKLVVKNTLYRTFKDKQHKQPGFLEDYAFFIAGLLDLYEATHDIVWLNHAITLDNIVENKFEDKVHGAFFMTSHDQDNLIAREKPAYDGAEPSGNSVHALNLLRLHEFTGKNSYQQRADNTLQYFSTILERQPAALSEMLLAIDFNTDQAKEIVIVTPDGKAYTAAPFIKAFRENYIPNHIFINVEEGNQLTEQTKTLPLLDQKLTKNNQATAYVCVQGVCEFPTTDPKVFTEQLLKVETYQ